MEEKKAVNLSNLTKFAKYVKMGDIEIAHSGVCAGDEGDSVSIDFHDTKTDNSLCVNYYADKGVLSMKKNFEEQKANLKGDKESCRKARKLLDKFWECYRLIAPICYLRARLDYETEEDRARGQFTSREIALYLMSIDRENVFHTNDEELLEEGIERLHIIMQMIQVIGYAYYNGDLIINDRLYIYKKGTAVKYFFDIHSINGYHDLIKIVYTPFSHTGLEIYDKNYKKDNSDSVFVTVKDFIDRIYQTFKDVPMDELRVLSEEDPEYTAHREELEQGKLIELDPSSHTEDEYREQYGDFLECVFR